MTARAAPRAPRAARATMVAAGEGAAPRWTVAPVLARHRRGEVVESVHRGDVVEADVTGRLLHVAGDPERLVHLRSTAKPFGLLALLEAGGRRAFDLSVQELALMTSSHSGEDLHVRTLGALFRRLAVPQAVLACSADPIPLDALTAARLQRDGERPSQLRHMCSGQHTVLVLLARLGGWPFEAYWEEEHPAHRAYAAAIAAAFGVAAAELRTAIDGCGVRTYAFRLREVARAFASLADPAAIPAADPRARLAPDLEVVRNAMLAYPELVGGTRDRLDTAIMKAAPGRLVSKAGMEALRGIAILPDRRGPTAPLAASGMAVKIEDGGGHDRASWAVSVEALRQAGALDPSALRVLARHHRPVELDPHGRTGAETVADFDLAPVGELTR